MVVVLPDDGLVVTAAPGTGSTALRSWAVTRPGAREVPAVDGDDVGGIDAKHATVRQVVAAGHRLPTDHLVVTGIRNPFSWWEAEWRRSRTRWVHELDDPDSWVHDTPGLAERIERAGRHDLSTWVGRELHAAHRRGDRVHLNPGHVGEADLVLRQESLEDDLAEVVAGAASVPRRNVTRPSDEADATWTDRVVAMVVDVHRPTFRRFEYDPDPPAPVRRG